MAKKLSVFIMLLALILVLPACESAEGKQDGKIKLTWWDYYGSEAAVAMNNAIKTYEKAHPNVNIERIEVPFGELKKKILLGAAGGELPDILIIDNPDHQMLAEAGILADLTKKVNVWGQEKNYFEGPLSSTVYKGKNYGIPLGSNNLALFYNEDLLKEAGIKPPKTWDELKNAAKKLTHNDVYGISVSAISQEEGTFQFLPFVWQAGSDLTHFNTQGSVDAISLWKELIDSHSMSKGVLTQTQQDVALQFINGKTAMMVNGTWQIPVLEKEKKLNWNVVELPGYKENSTILGGENYAITSTSKHKEAAWNVLMFLQEKENAKKILIQKGNLPPRKDYIQDEYWQKDPRLKTFANSMEFAKARAYGAYYPSISEEIQKMMQEVLTGSMPADQAVKQAAKKIKRYITQ
ncbi:sugar ABC transporter substrate-binding protein [Fictibacillus enclensis]|uniref:ABC transporter substrate-binding protein n=1 Tax=Fictibacillus enclensis TaxID=1017270 RepID=UPI0025A1056C|nr:sugar ABC transporter substrate-binding protein [Fictibacillus enclensis]MDM5199374.1 sugar ABC transporter substrate-binding protein [Fictibacillus enclensis]